MQFDHSLENRQIQFQDMFLEGHRLDVILGISYWRNVFKYHVLKWCFRLDSLCLAKCLQWVFNSYTRAWKFDSFSYLKTIFPASDALLAATYFERLYFGIRFILTCEDEFLKKCATFNFGITRGSTCVLWCSEQNGVCIDPISHQLNQGKQLNQ